MSAVRLLAIDSSTEALSLAACCGPREAHLSCAGGAQASAQLLPQAQALLQSLNLPLASLDGIAFGCGPGAFTGLRTAASVAQGLAYGLSCPLVPIDSLMLVAQAAAQGHGLLQPADTVDIAVVMDARMGELYAAWYRWRLDTGWRVGSPAALWSPAALAAAWAGLQPTACAGSGTALLAAQAPDVMGWASLAVSDDQRAAALLPLARQGWAQGPRLPAAQGLPLYLRDKVALTTAERAAALSPLRPPAPLSSAV
jgi:tRNA threonylcarbamoyladenosine biosynthesis protein TsaB